MENRNRDYPRRIIFGLRLPFNLTEKGQVTKDAVRIFGLRAAGMLVNFCRGTVKMNEAQQGRLKEIIIEKVGPENCQPCNDNCEHWSNQNEIAAEKLPSPNVVRRSILRGPGRHTRGTTK